MLGAGASRSNVGELLVEADGVEMLLEELWPRECRLLWEVDMKSLWIVLVLRLLKRLWEVNLIPGWRGHHSRCSCP
jgi:hypothetical protein